MGEMTMGWQVLSLRMTSAPQRDEGLHMGLRAVNAFSPKSPELAHGGGEKQTIPSWHSSTLGITSACISTTYQFEDENDGKAPTSAPLLPPPTEHHGRPRTPATLVTSHWHKWLPSSAITTLEPDVVAIHQAVNRMGSQVKLYSYLQAEEVRRWDLAEEQKNQTRQQDQPEPVGVRFPAYLEMAREASSNEFVAWYGPVWLSLSTHNRHLIRERDVNIDILEYLLHEREWQFYRNKTRGNWKKTRWFSTPPPGEEGAS
ncbi:hypothetical protein CGCFRS4_v014512 [Colletotrichum fructicola]|nr:hypothetical protein CGCFRS4_v014512 [Colletotrichum fructicola]